MHGTCEMEFISNIMDDVFNRRNVFSKSESHFRNQERDFGFKLKTDFSIRDRFRFRDQISFPVFGIGFRFSKLDFDFRNQLYVLFEMK